MLYACVFMFQNDGDVHSVRENNQPRVALGALEQQGNEVYVCTITPHTSKTLTPAIHSHSVLCRVVWCMIVHDMVLEESEKDPPAPPVSACYPLWGSRDSHHLV